MQHVFALGGMSFICGLFATMGMWVFCKVFRWAPVNITVRVHQSGVDLAVGEQKLPVA